MSLLLFYDTETTGLPLYGEPSSDPRQPHIVSIAASLVDAGNRREVARFDAYIRPEGWTIPPETTAIHGITTEQASRIGLPADMVIRTLLALWKLADKRVAHNESFDARIVRIALKRHMDEATADHWKAGAAACSMRLARPLCGLEGNKTPTLAEAHRLLCGTELANAHNARADVDGCMAVYFAAGGF